MMEQQEFSRRYLEREREGSSIYYEENVSDGATLYYRILPGDVSYPPSMLARAGWFAGLGVALAVAVLAVGLFGGFGKEKGLLATAEAYDKIAAAQTAFLGGRLDDAAFHLHDASAGLDGARATDIVSQTALALASVLSFGGGDGNESPGALNGELADAARAAVAAAQPLLGVTRAVLFSSETPAGNTLPLGMVFSDSLERSRTAKEKVDAVRKKLAAFEAGALSTFEQREIAALTPRLALVSVNLQSMIDRLDLGAWMLGAAGPRRFLLAAQDTGIPRATGGFIASYGVLETSGGVITKLAFDDVYNLDGGITTNVVPPRPIQSVSTVWTLRNANWFLDFPLSARKMSVFFTEASGKGLDGVVALDAKALGRVLDVVGPVAVPGIEGLVATSFNAGEFFTGRTEVGFSQKSPYPPGILGDIARAVTDAVAETSKERLVSVFRAVESGFEYKDIALWLADAERQRRASEYGWSGELADAAGSDYLAVVVSDIAGVSGESAVTRILKETRFETDSSVLNTLVIEFGDPKAAIVSEEKRYVRTYVPLGSELLEASGNTARPAVTPAAPSARERFVRDPDIPGEGEIREGPGNTELYTESGRTVFGGWVFGSPARLIYRYRVPFFRGVAAGGTFSSVFQRQPGAATTVHYSVFAPDGRTFKDGYTESNVSEFSSELSSDAVFTVTLK